MLLVLKVEGLENLNLEDMEAGKKVKVEGIVQGMYFDENYIKQLEEKAKKYDEHISKVIENPNAFKCKYKTN